MTRLSETDEYQANSILDAFDLVAMAMLIGILLFILGTPASWGATSPPNLRPPASVATTSEPFEKAEQSTRETKVPMNVNLEKEVTARTRPQAKEITSVGAGRSENEIRADEITVHLLAPWH